MCLSQKKTKIIKKFVREHIRKVKNKTFWTYAKIVRISTSHKSYCYIGSTDNKKERERLCAYTSTVGSKQQNLTAVERFIVNHLNIITSNVTTYNTKFYEDDIINDDKLCKLVIKQAEQLLLNEYKLRAINDTSIVVLNINNPFPLKPPLASRNSWGMKPFICPCGFLKKGCNYTCGNSNKTQHCRQNYTHLEWLKNQPL